MGHVTLFSEVPDEVEELEGLILGEIAILGLGLSGPFMPMLFKKAGHRVDHVLRERKSTAQTF